MVYYEYPATGCSDEVLIMIHGYRGNHRGLEAIAAGLSEYRVLIPDLPGFGESEPLNARHSVVNYAVWLNHFTTELFAHRHINLMGHSFGSLIVGDFATKYNARSVSLVNPVSTPALDGPQAALTGLTRSFYRLASILPNIMGQWLLRSGLAVMIMSVVMAKTKDKLLRRWIHRQHLENFSDFASVQVAVEGYHASISSDLSMIAPSILQPVLVVAAELDDITEIASQRRVAKTYPNAVLREIQGVGHLVHYEAPEQAAFHIQQFIKDLL